MKVAFFCGPTEYSICLANALASFCDVTFFYSKKNNNERFNSVDKLLMPEIKKEEINSYRIRDIRNIKSYYAILKKMDSFDLIHVQTGNIWFGLWYFLLNIKKPICFTVHDPYQHQNTKNIFYQGLAQKIVAYLATKYIVHGAKMKKDLIKNYSLESKDANIIPHGNFLYYKQIKNSENKIITENKNFKRILFFGSVRPNKGIAYLIKAEPYISQQYSDYKICIAGKIPDDQLKYYKSLMENSNKFELLNKFIPDTQVAWLFENSDIVVLPYTTATQSGVLALAFSFGKAVVATNTGSIGEILESKHTGLLVPPKSESKLSDAIVELLLDEQKCLKYGYNAQTYAETKLNWHNIAKETVSIYKGCIKSQ